MPMVRDQRFRVHSRSQTTRSLGPRVSKIERVKEGLGFQPPQLLIPKPTIWSAGAGPDLQTWNLYCEVLHLQLDISQKELRKLSTRRACRTPLPTNKKTKLWVGLVDGFSTNFRSHRLDLPLATHSSANPALALTAYA